MKSHMKPKVQTNRIITPLRFALSIRALSRPHADSVEATRDYMTARKKERNTITINTKKTRPVIIPRENLDTPPTITDYVREFSRIIRNNNNLITHLDRIAPHLSKHIITAYNDAPTFTKAYGDPAKMLKRPRPLWTFNDWTRRPYTEAGNINHEDKPAFRHDSLYLFDLLSED